MPQPEHSGGVITGKVQKCFKILEDECTTLLRKLASYSKGMHLNVLQDLNTHFQNFKSRIKQIL